MITTLVTIIRVRNNNKDETSHSGDSETAPTFFNYTKYDINAEYDVDIDTNNDNAGKNRNLMVNNG